MKFGGNQTSFKFKKLVERRPDALISTHASIRCAILIVEYCVFEEVIVYAVWLTTSFVGNPGKNYNHNCTCRAQAEWHLPLQKLMSCQAHADNKFFSYIVH